MHWDTFKKDNYSIVGGHGGCRVGEVRAGTTSPMLDYKGYKYLTLEGFKLSPIDVCNYQVATYKSEYL